MICKNCSAPYHGYRNCPQPANLNTMLQLFMEFCMQQLQNFSKEVVTNTNDGVPKPLIDSGTSTTASNHKSNKLKRKQQKAAETHAKTKQTKKRKLSITNKKKSSKNDSDDSSDSDEDDDNNSEASSSESDDDSSDSSANESLVSSKKKLKMKNKNASKAAALNLSNFTPNPVNIPLVLNGFPNLAVGPSAVQNPNTSSNALNTLLLTQMFQNAIGSLKQ